MIKKILSLLICLGYLSLQNIFAQHTIIGQFYPKNDLRTILLYKTEGAFQYYKASTQVDEEGAFGFALPENFPSGSYRLVYDAQKNLYINIIYNNEDISFVADPTNALASAVFNSSIENAIFYDYLRQINEKYSKLDSIQYLYFDDNNKQFIKSYTSALEEINAFQLFFEEKAKGMLVESYIKAFKKSNSTLPFKTKRNFFNFLKISYLDHINFEDKTLQNSSFIIDRLNEYIFDLNETIATKFNEKLDTKLIDDALSKIKASDFKNDAIYSLTSSAFDPYSSAYDILLDHLYHNYYKQIPIEKQNEELNKLIISKLKVIVGKKAPNIVLGDTSMYNIKAENTLVMFWSSTCSHCLKEIPLVYEALQDSSKLKVVLVGLEDSYSDWENVILSFPKWTHLRANGKWDNEYAKSYNVKSTPAYYLLDKNKVIIAKPNDYKALLELFDKK